MGRFTVALFALLLAVATASQARHGSGGGRGGAGRDEPGGDAALPFSTYTLSLSWSATFCESPAGSGSPQCDGASRGFVLHGLWPEYRGNTVCTRGPALTAAQREVGDRIFPDPKLTVHEWQKHGRCSGFNANDYFELADRARKSIRIPDRFAPGRRSTALRGAEIAGLFREANPGITSQSIVLTCAQRELSEVRICLDTQLRPRACERRSNSCGSGQLQVNGVK